MTNFSEVIRWCERQGNCDILKIISILRQSPEMTGSGIALLLWDEAGGSRDEHEAPEQTEENVVRLYRMFPSLAPLRPLLMCPECQMPGVNLMDQILHFQGHGWSAGRVANHLETFWAPASKGK